jgi:nucleoside-diphosphate-sugar epimerase
LEQEVKRIIVCGSSGFIGTHLVRQLCAEGHYVIGIDRKIPQFGSIEAQRFVHEDITLWPPRIRDPMWKDIDEVYQLAADMGGAGYLFSGEHDAEVMATNARINLNVLEAVHRFKIPRIFFASSACVYQSLPEDGCASIVHTACREEDAYPAMPDSEYGFEKLFSERLYLAYQRNYGTNVRIGRFHNVFGEEGTWRGGREKAPAAICRKVAETEDRGIIDIWGDGNQTRSFMHVADAVEGAIRLCRSDFTGPVNIGSDEMVSVNYLVQLVAAIAGKRIFTRSIDGPIGVRGRNSDNRLIREKLGWAPSISLWDGLAKTYPWIEEQVRKAREEGS